MIPVGYMAKKIEENPTYIKTKAIKSICSVSGHLSEPFCDYIVFWKHNNYWFYNNPEEIYNLAQEHDIDISHCRMFYYEMYENEFSDGDDMWHEVERLSFSFTSVLIPKKPLLLGYDVITTDHDTSPRCSPLSCNGLEKEISVNEYCLISSLDEAKSLLEASKFNSCNNGSYRIFAVYSLPEGVK